MTTGFQAADARRAGPAAKVVASWTQSAITDYSRRLRPRVLSASASSASASGAYFDRIYRDNERADRPRLELVADPVIHRLRQFLTMSDGWDGELAPAPAPAAVEMSETIVLLGREVGVVPSRIVPDVEGGIAVYYFGGELLPDGGRRLQSGVLVSNDRELVLYRRDRETEEEHIDEIEPTHQGLREALGIIKNFVAGT